MMSNLLLFYLQECFWRAWWTVECVADISSSLLEVVSQLSPSYPKTKRKAKRDLKSCCRDVFLDPRITTDLSQRRSNSSACLDNVSEHLKNNPGLKTDWWCYHSLKKETTSVYAAAVMRSRSTDYFNLKYVKRAPCTFSSISQAQKQGIVFNI